MFNAQSLSDYNRAPAGGRPTGGEADNPPWNTADTVYHLSQKLSSREDNDGRSK